MLFCWLNGLDATLFNEISHFGRYEIIYSVNCEIESIRFLWNKINPFITRRKAYFILRSNISRTKCISQIRRIYFIEKTTCRNKSFFLVAGGGFEPPTFGLSLRAGLRCPKLFLSRCSLDTVLTAAPVIALFLRLAAFAITAQRATLVCLITRLFLYSFVSYNDMWALPKQSHINFFPIHYYLLPPKNPYNNF